MGKFATGPINRVVQKEVERVREAGGGHFEHFSHSTKCF